jgi:hypothetical protein
LLFVTESLHFVAELLVFLFFNHGQSQSQIHLYNYKSQFRGTST